MFCTFNLSQWQHIHRKADRPRLQVQLIMRNKNSDLHKLMSYAQTQTYRKYTIAVLMQMRQTLLCDSSQSPCHTVRVYTYCRGLSTVYERWG